jgi:hypothetical protein
MRAIFSGKRYRQKLSTQSVDIHVDALGNSALYRAQRTCIPVLLKP